MAEIKDTYVSMGEAQANLSWNACSVQEDAQGRTVTFANAEGVVATFRVNPDGSLVRSS